MAMRYRCFIFFQVGIFQVPTLLNHLYSTVLKGIFITSWISILFFCSIISVDVVLHYFMIKAVLCFCRAGYSLLHLYSFFFSLCFIPFPAWLFFCKSFEMFMYNFRKRLISIFIGIVLDLKLEYLYVFFFNRKTWCFHLLILFFFLRTF